VLRLYTRTDFESRPAYETPEIRRADLSETSLLLHGTGIRDISTFPWFEAPPKSSMEAAEALLLKLGAIAQDGRITDTGIRMLHFPVHPRLARLIVEGKNLNVVEECTLLAALLSEKDIRLNTRTSFGPKTSGAQGGASGKSDLLELLEYFEEAESAHFAPERLLDLGLDPGAIQAVRRSHRQLRRVAGGRAGPIPGAAEEGLLIAVLSAFPDRVARRRNRGSREILLAGGGAATLSNASVVHNPEFLVAVDAEERRERIPADSGTVIRLASAIEIEWLAGLFPEAISQKTELIWNEQAGRVDQFSCTSYGQITLEEKTNPAPRSGETTRILSSVAIARQLSDFKDVDSLPAFRARVTLVARHFPGEKFPSVEDRVLNKAVERLCAGKRSLEELAQESLIHELAATLTDRQRHLLDREAPERIKLKTGRSVKVHYESDRPPWIESRLQDFFGMSATPTICAGLAPLTVHLLAPNGRAVQVTSDLAGFWERHYPSIRRELKRRYPKHAWPEPFAIDN
jgi:ATP-dependent helicase HrpB